MFIFNIKIIINNMLGIIKIKKKIYFNIEDKKLLGINNILII